MPRKQDSLRYARRAPSGCQVPHSRKKLAAPRLGQLREQAGFQVCDLFLWQSLGFLDLALKDVWHRTSFGPICLLTENHTPDTQWINGESVQMPDGGIRQGKKRIEERASEKSFRGAE